MAGGNAVAMLLSSDRIVGELLGLLWLSFLLMLLLTPSIGVTSADDEQTAVAVDAGNGTIVARDTHDMGTTCETGPVHRRNGENVAADFRVLVSRSVGQLVVRLVLIFPCLCLVACLG